MLTVPDFTCKTHQIDWMIKNKSMLIAQKKATIKHADAFSGATYYILDDNGPAILNKADAIPATAKKIKVRSIVNTTKLFDSHGDVHIDQLWNKNIKDQKENYLVKQHQFDFDGIISDNVHVHTKQIPWHELGYNYEGKTQALIYDSIIDRDDMPDATKSMFDKYRMGKVKQHSVGMRYVALSFAVNDDRYPDEFATWEKYFDEIANKDDALENGFFWAVTIAKNIEGSAVVKGSNYATPTLDVEEKHEPEPAKSIPGEPAKSIRVNVSELINFYNPKI